MDQTVTLRKEQWEQILTILADVPWRISNPLLMAIGNQLRVQQQEPPSNPPNIADGDRAGGGKIMNS